MPENNRYAMPPENNQYQNSSQDRRLDSIESHIAIINSELGEVKIAMEKMRTDVATMKGEICGRLGKIESRLAWYVFLTPILLGIIGFLAAKFF